MRKRSINITVDSYDKNDQPGNESLASPTTLYTKKVNEKPKRLPKMSKNWSVDMVIDSNNKSSECDKATPTGLPEL